MRSLNFELRTSNVKLRTDVRLAVVWRRPLEERVVEESR